MQIVLDKRKNGKILDSVDYILNTDKKTFNKIFKILNNPNGELDFVYENEVNNSDITMEVFNISSFLKAISEIKNNKINLIEKSRLYKLQKCRTTKILKNQISKTYKLDRNTVNEIFEILDGNKDFFEFIKSKELEKKQKRNIFSFFKIRNKKMLDEGKNYTLNYYLEIMQKISYGEYSFNYFLPNEQEYGNKVSLISNQATAKMDIIDYPIVLGKDDEPDWKISDELKNYVYKDMPQNITPEEKSIYIYMKLCNTLSYDDKKIFEEKSNKIDINLLENIKPNSKVICFDFSRIYAKFVNTIPNSDLEAKVVGGNGHFLVYLINKNIAVKAEATNALSGTNEFFKVKMGLPVQGLSILFDKYNIVDSSIKKFTPLIYKDVQTIENYMNMLDKIREDEKTQIDKEDENELFNKLNSLTKTMQLNNVNGIEAVSGIMNFCSFGFFGENIEKSWLKHKMVSDNGDIYYSSSIILGKKDDNNNFCILNSNDMTINELNKEEVIEKFNNEEYSYKDSKYIIESLKDDLPIIPDENEKKEDIEK